MQLMKMGGRKLIGLLVVGLISTMAKMAMNTTDNS